MKEFNRCSSCGKFKSWPHLNSMGSEDEGWLECTDCLSNFDRERLKLDNNKKIEEKLLIDFIQQEINKSLETCIGTTNLDSVKENLSKVLNDIHNKNLIDQDFKVGRCGQLWSLWSFKQKLKWYFCNKTPIVKDLSDQIRKGIDDYNSLLWDNEVGEYVGITKEYPEYLNTSPKTTMVVDTQIKLKQAIEFIRVDLTLSDK